MRIVFSNYNSKKLNENNEFLFKFDVVDDDENADIF